MQQAGEFALRARGGLQRGRVHSGDREQALLQIVQDAQAALRNFRGLFRDARWPGHRDARRIR